MTRSKLKIDRTVKVRRFIVSSLERSHQGRGVTIFDVERADAPAELWATTETV
jgi:hypothetical protein